MPDEPEIHGLLALMLLNDARRDARFADGTIVLLRDQDRSLWDARQIAEGREVLERALALGGRGPYVVQATIAALHVDDPPDWARLADLYRRARRPHGLDAERRFLEQRLAELESGTPIVGSGPEGT
jgi:RNA polymerase sigma-70 factor (ECF subfamily)